VTQEPEYLRRLREAQAAKQQKAVAAPAASQNPHEQEAIRWAKGVAAGQEIRSVRNLATARFAVLVRLQSASGSKFLSLDGLPDREALKERVKPGATVGEEVLGAYEIKGGRPVTISLEEGQVVLKMGDPRPGANPLTPDQMLRKAAAEAAQLAKTRPRDTGRGGGGGGRGR